MLTILNSDGTFTGVQYPSDTPAIRAHHAALNQICIEYSGRIPVHDEDGNYPVIDNFLSVTKIAKLATINAECQSTILSKFSIVHQLDVANGLYADNGMKAWIADMIAESNRCTDLIELGQEAVPVWPEYVEVV